MQIVMPFRRRFCWGSQSPGHFANLMLAFAREYCFVFISNYSNVPLRPQNAYTTGVPQSIWPCRLAWLVNSISESEIGVFPYYAQFDHLEELHMGSRCRNSLLFCRAQELPRSLLSYKGRHSSCILSLLHHLHTHSVCQFGSVAH